ncbi:MAG: RNA polymerase sigma factor [bacterium]|nr:RNA polymerase sigma factor [bacterium]
MNHPVDSSSDGELMERALADDRCAFEQLAMRYQASLMRGAISRLRRVDWSEDVVQETFLNAWRWRQSYDSQYSVRSWLWTILLNNCRRLGARNSRQPTVKSWADQAEEAETNAAKPTSRDPLPADVALAKERSQQVIDLLATLPEPEADALRMRFFGELKFQEIADAMHCSLSGAKRRVRNGLSRMSATIEVNQSPTVD